MRTISTVPRMSVVLVAVLAVSSWQPVASTAAPSSGTGSVPVVGGAETVSLHERDDLRGDVLTASIAVGWGGRVSAAWYRRPPEASDLPGRLMSSIRNRNGVWSDPVRISRRIPEPAYVFLAAGRGGRVSAVWISRGPSGRLAVFASHRQDGEWGSRERLGRGDYARVVHDGRGVAHVMWANKRVVIASRATDGTWTRRKFAVGDEPESYELSTNRAGDAIAMWDESGCFCVSTATKTRDSTTWHRRREPAGAYFFDFAPGLGVFPGGRRALAAWIYGEKLSWAQRSATGVWSPPREFGEPTGSIEQNGSMRMSVSPRGHALALWSTQWGGYIASRYRPGHGFGKPSRLGERGAGFHVGGGMVTSDGAALVAGVTQHGQVGYRWQRGPWRDWRPLRALNSEGDLAAVNARGRRIAVLFVDEGLRVRVIDLVA